MKILSFDVGIKNLPKEFAVIELQKQIQSILNEKGKLHHKTLQKINKQITNTINNNNKPTNQHECNYCRNKSV